MMYRSKAFFIFVILLVGIRSNSEPQKDPCHDFALQLIREYMSDDLDRLHKANYKGYSSQYYPKAQDLDLKVANDVAKFAVFHQEEILIELQKTIDDFANRKSQDKTQRENDEYNRDYYQKVKDELKNVYDTQSEEDVRFFVQQGWLSAVEVDQFDGQSSAYRKRFLLSDESKVYRKKKEELDTKYLMLTFLKDEASLPYYSPYADMTEYTYPNSFDQAKILYDDEGKAVYLLLSIKNKAYKNQDLVFLKLEVPSAEKVESQKIPKDGACWASQMTLYQDTIKKANLIWNGFPNDCSYANALKALAEKTSGKYNSQEVSGEAKDKSEISVFDRAYGFSLTNMNAYTELISPQTHQRFISQCNKFANNILNGTFQKDDQSTKACIKSGLKEKFPEVIDLFK